MHDCIIVTGGGRAEQKMQGRCFHAVGDIVWAYSLGMTIQNMSMAMSMWWLSRFLMAQVTLDQFYWIQALIHLFLHWNLQDQGQLRVQPR